MSLREAIQEAVTTNPRIDVEEARRRASQSGLRQAKGRLLPEIDIEADIGKQRIDRPNGLGPDVNDVWRKRRQVTASVSQIIFDGFERAYDIYRSQARITATTHKVIAQSEAVSLAAVEAYIDVVRHQELLGLAKENIERHERIAEIIRANFEGGNVPLGDLEQTEERIQAAKAFESRIRVAYGEAKAKFRSVVGSEPSSLRPVPYARNLPGSVAQVMEAAIQNNPRIHASEAEIDVALYEKRQFESTLYPRVSLEGKYTRGEDLEGTPGRNNEIAGMVMLRWKLFDGGIRVNRIDELNERQFEKMAQRDVMIRELRRDVESSWARFVDGRAQVEAVRNQVSQNEKVVKTYFDEYQADRRNLLDVLDAENAGFASRFDLSNISALHIYSTYQLLAQMGVLMDRFGVAAPVADYNDDSFFPAIEPLSANSDWDIPPLD